MTSSSGFTYSIWSREAALVIVCFRPQSGLSNSVLPWRQLLPLATFCSLRPSVTPCLKITSRFSARRPRAEQDDTPPPPPPQQEEEANTASHHTESHSHHPPPPPCCTPMKTQTIMIFGQAGIDRHLRGIEVLRSWLLQVAVEGEGMGTWNRGGRGDRVCRN